MFQFYTTFTHANDSVVVSLRMDGRNGCGGHLDYCDDELGSLPQEDRVLEVSLSYWLNWLGPSWRPIVEQIPWSRSWWFTPSIQAFWWGEFFVYADQWPNTNLSSAMGTAMLISVRDFLCDLSLLNLYYTMTSSRSHPSNSTMRHFLSCWVNVCFKKCQAVTFNWHLSYRLYELFSCLVRSPFGVLSWIWLLTEPTFRLNTRNYVRDRSNANKAFNSFDLSSIRIESPSEAYWHKSRQPGITVTVHRSAMSDLAQWSNYSWRSKTVIMLAPAHDL